MIALIDDARDRQKLIEDAKLARASLDAVMPYFSLQSELPDYHPDAVAWFRDCLRRSPGQGRPFIQTARQLQAIQEAVEIDPAKALTAQRQVMRYIMDVLAPEIIALLDLLQSGLETQEMQRQAWAKRMRKDADDAVARIQSVSQMVRLISLNASVEAARAGTSGKAFAVIAHEVKALSESIRESAGKVTQSIQSLTDKL